MFWHCCILEQLLLQMKCIKSLATAAVLLVLGACGQHAIEAEQQAKLLTDSAMNLASSSSKSEDLQKSIELLDAAIAKSKTYYDAYWNKLIIQNQLGLRNEAYATLEKLQELRPTNPDLKATAGVFLLLKGDSVAAKQKFTEADKLFSNVIDTLHNINDPYQTYRVNKAINLRFLGNEQEAQLLFDSVYKLSDNPTLLAFVYKMRTMPRAEMLKRFGAQ